MRTRRGRAVVGALVALLALPGCAAGAEDDTLTVFAAASLAESIEELADRFEAGHPGVDVVVSAGGSSALAQQLVAGASADVFAAANPETMATAVEAGVVAEEVPLARNRLEIAVPPGNPAGVAGLAAFADPALRLALCAPEVPCGAAAAVAFAAAGVTPEPDTLEQDVTAVLTKVRLGEVDAGLVYRTDVLAAGADVAGIAFPEARSAETECRIAVLAGASPRAQEFVDFALGDGRQILAEAGFAAP